MVVSMAAWMAALMVVSKAAKLGVEMVETKAVGRAELKDK